MIYKINPEIEEYFIEQYKKSGFRVVPGHWPEMNTKEDVDDWINIKQKVLEAFRKDK
jgi:hypothetical protein